MNDDFIKNLTKQGAKILCQNASDGKVLEGLFVGRTRETKAIFDRIENATNGTSSVVFIVGNNGIGKSTFVNHITSIAKNDFNDIVSAFKIENERFSGTGTRELYCQFIKNLEDRTCQKESALEVLLQNFAEKLQDENTNTALDEINTTFAHVIGLYIEANNRNDDKLRHYALKWLKGEYLHVQSAREELGHDVEFIINNQNAVLMIKNWISLFSFLGRTTIVSIDEMQRLSKLDEGVARNNWAVIENLYDINKNLKVVFLFSGTNEMIDRNNKRGLFSNPDLSSRLGGKTFNKEGLADFSQSIIYLSSITNQYEHLEYLSYLKKIKEIAIGRELQVSESDLQNYLSKVKKEKEIYDPKQGPSENEVNVPIRDIMKDFMRILALMEYYPEKSFSELCGFNSQMPQAGETNINNDQIEVL